MASLCDEADFFIVTLKRAPKTVTVDSICASVRRMTEVLISSRATSEDGGQEVWGCLMDKFTYLQMYCDGALSGLAKLSRLVATATATAETAIAQITQSGPFSSSATCTFNNASVQFERALKTLLASKYMTAELAANLSAASTVRLTNNILVNAAGLGKNCPADPHHLSYLVERHVSQLAEQLFTDKTAVTPATVAQMLQAIPTVWVSAATYDFKRMALEMVNSGDEFASLAPRLHAKQTSLRVSANAPHHIKTVAERLITAILLHHRGADLPRITLVGSVQLWNIAKRLKEVLTVLEDARFARILAQQECEGQSTETDEYESLAVLRLRLNLQLKNVFRQDNPLNASVRRFFAMDAKQFLGRVMHLVKKDIELIERFACPRSQPPVAKT